MTCVRCERGDVLDRDQSYLRERGGGTGWRGSWEQRGQPTQAGPCIQLHALGTGLGRYMHVRYFVFCTYLSYPYLAFSHRPRDLLITFVLLLTLSQFIYTP